MSIKIAVIGAGMMGARHASNLATKSGVDIAFICDADAARAEAIAAEVGATHHTIDPQSCVRHDDVDAIIVASPDKTHADLVMAALEVGKPILCEKPLASSVDQCRKIVEAEMAGGRRLVTVGFMRRFDPAYLDLKKTLTETVERDDVLMLHCAHRNANCPDWFNADFAITNSAVHEVDISRWLLGEEIESVQIVSRKQSPKSAFQDPQYIVMRTQSGTLVTVEISMNAHYGYEICAEVVCADQILTLARPPLTTIRRSGAERLPISDDWLRRFERAYDVELSAWLAGLAGRYPVGASAWDGMRAVMVTDACLRSKESGGEVVVENMARPEFYAEAKIGGG